jgi:AraC family transcriptional regulator of adaptative response/methylated-DNA-[protein]-cysteine methyltransferase
VEKICAVIEARLDNPPTLANLALETGLSQFHLQRLFKKIIGATPREYAANRRLLAMKQNLQSGADVTTSLFDAGFGSTSRVYENSNSRLGMTPATYGRKGRGARIRYGTADCALGQALVASTDLGVCAILFGNTDGELVAALRTEFSEASLSHDPVSVRLALDAVLQHLNDSSTALNLPLDIRATAFQLRVWKHLQTIPPGATQSYAQAAAALGTPSAARAVARACATNNVAVAIPCHRIVRQDGALGGYRWGLKRKEQLLAAERKSRAARANRNSP